MFRASDIFGRKPGGLPNRPTVQAEPGAAQKRPSDAVSRTWDPATGKYYDEDLPADVQAMMGIAPKKVKTEVKAEQEAWGPARKSTAKALGPSSVGMAPLKGDKRLPKSGDVDKAAPSVEYKGFSKVDINDRYYEKNDVHIHGKPTYWTEDAQFFLYWQGEVKRWSICDAASFFAVKAGQYPGWAYKEDHKHLAQASGWMEAWNGEWREPALEVTYRSSAKNAPQWEDPALQKAIATVEFQGFAMKELNTRYLLRASEYIQGRPTFWDSSGVYFIYWQAPMNRWAICDLKCLEAVKEGQCPGWAYRADSKHFANACGWMERRSDEWVGAIIETSVVGACTQGLKVEFYGFAKEELNTQYMEKADVEIQGRSTLWDPSGTYFIYWQSSMSRWAVCDTASLSAAKSGLAPGWAYRTDAAHFTRSRGWMEVWGRDWKKANITCTVLEGNVEVAHNAVKSELNEDADFSAQQYTTLIRKIYEARNPAKLDDLDRLLEKYGGREHELYRNVCEKYEVDADEFAVEQAPTLGAIHSAPAAPAKEAEEDEEEFAELEGAAFPDLSAQEYAIHIQSIYECHNPKKLVDMGRLLQKYRHNERELYRLVCEKYSLHPAKYNAKNRKEVARVKAEMA